MVNSDHMTHESSLRRHEKQTKAIPVRHSSGFDQRRQRQRRDIKTLIDGEDCSLGESGRSVGLPDTRPTTSLQFLFYLRGQSVILWFVLCHL